MTTVRRLSLVLVLGMVLAACGGGKTFTAAEVRRVLLQPSEAPAGTQYNQDSSGARTLEQFASDDPNPKKFEADLRAAGVTSINLTNFGTPGLFDAMTAPSGGQILVNIMAAFKTTAGTRKAFQFLAAGIRLTGKDLTPLPASGLGADALGLSGRVGFNPFPTVLYAWRVDNVIVAVFGAGDPSVATKEEVRAAAEKVSTRLSGTGLTVTDLERAQLKASEAPSGTALVEEQSGARTVDQFAPDERAVPELKKDGFAGGWAAAYSTADFFAKARPQENGRFVTSFGLLFKDSAGAASGLDLLQKDVRAASRDAKIVGTSGLGDASFGITFSGSVNRQQPFPGVAVYWRTGNAVFFVFTAGDPKVANLAAATKLAEKIDARAA